MRAAFNKLLPYLKPHWVRFAQAGAAMVVVAATQAGIVYLVKPIIDQIFITKNAHTLIGVVLALPLLFIVRGLATYAMNYLMGSASQKAAQKLREDLFRHLTRLSVEFFWRQRTGEILSRVTNDLNAVQDTMQYVPLFAVRDTLTVMGLIGILFYLNWKFALMSFFMAPVIGIFLDRIGNKMRNAARQSQAHMADLYHLFAEALHGMTVIKAFHYEEGANRKFREENARYFGQMMRYLRAMSLSAPVLEFLGSLGGVAFLYFGARQVFAGQMSAGDFFTFMGALFAAYMPLKNLATAYAKVQIGIASTERLFHILDEKPSVVEPERPVAFRHLNDCIELRGVGYMYPSRELWALRGVSLKVRKGEAVAVVGQSGSGKSTLIGLLLRLFDPVEGAVLFDGVDLRELALGQLRDQMGLVTQETTLFNDTVAGNVALGRDATRAEIEEACRAAAAEDFILGLPKGYDTPLGDRGVQLSGGQRQRLAIARALLSNPSILLLDEATSNLDSRSERQIQEALANLQRGRTVLTVAHRLSTVQNADRIIVMNEGRVVEEGTHKGLLAAGGAYQRLYELQTTAPED